MKFTVALAAVAFLTAGCVAGNPGVRSAVAGMKVVMGSKPFKVTAMSSLNPDCTSVGIPVGRVIVPPSHGTVEFRKGTDYPRFPPHNPRSACNGRKVPGLQVFYIPTPGYVGPDSFTIETVFPDGMPFISRYPLDVRP